MQVESLFKTAKTGFFLLIAFLSYSTGTQIDAGGEPHRGDQIGALRPGIGHGDQNHHPRSHIGGGGGQLSAGRFAIFSFLAQTFSVVDAILGT